MKTKFKTKDIALAAALILSNQKLISTEQEGFSCWFIFEDNQRCEELSNKYYFQELLVNARDFQETLKRLKNIIFTK